jgi:homoserine dehydrogenase
MSERTLKVAVLGCGAVGSQVVRLLTEQHDDLAARVGAPVELVGVAVRRLDDALLAIFGEQYVTLEGNSHRVPLLRARLEKLSTPEG